MSDNNTTHLLYGGKTIKIDDTIVTVESGAGIICSFVGDDGVVAKRRVSWKDQKIILPINLEQVYYYMHANLDGEIICLSSPQCDRSGCLLYLSCVTVILEPKPFIGRILNVERLRNKLC